MNSKSVTTLAGLALASALLLGACTNSQSQSKSTTSTSSSQTTKTSSSSSSGKAGSSVNSSQTVEGATGTTLITPETVASATNVASESVETVEETPATDQVADESVFANFVGTWSNDQGYTITINPDGTTADGGKLETRNGAVIGIRSLEGFGAAVFYASSGQEFSLAEEDKAFTEGTDISKERLVIAQDLSAMAHPYYRAN
ncbi:DUF6287 domain-containing protein [Streptococcus sp. DD10]|uniref:DUF6287 domain-containing protein n=1 Tax=Streptococcus sp. DD10 TaxID=1777878 RepID=UPI0018D27F5C|nr:DUF6287 domain-containing protein [Streptococcus sp. DD10]